MEGFRLLGLRPLKGTAKNFRKNLKNQVIYKFSKTSNLSMKIIDKFYEKFYEKMKIFNQMLRMLLFQLMFQQIFTLNLN